MNILASYTSEDDVSDGDDTITPSRTECHQSDVARGDTETGSTNKKATQVAVEVRATDATTTTATAITPAIATAAGLCRPTSTHSSRPPGMPPPGKALKRQPDESESQHLQASPSSVKMEISPYIPPTQYQPFPLIRPPPPSPPLLLPPQYYGQQHYFPQFAEQQQEHHHHHHHQQQQQQQQQIIQPQQQQFIQPQQPQHQQQQLLSQQQQQEIYLREIANQQKNKGSSGPTRGFQRGKGHILSEYPYRGRGRGAAMSGKSGEDFDPMDPSAYSDAPRGKWGNGMENKKKAGANISNFL